MANSTAGCSLKNVDGILVQLPLPKGYDEKYFYDEGYFLGTAHPKIGELLGYLLVYKHKEYVSDSKFSRKEIMCFISNGIKDAKKNK